MRELAYIRESLESIMRECDAALANLAEAEHKEADTQEAIDRDCQGSSTWYLLNAGGMDMESVQALSQTERTFLKLDSLMRRQKALMDGE